MKFEKIAEGLAGVGLIAFLPDEPIGLPVGLLLIADSFGLKL